MLAIPLATLFSLLALVTCYSFLYIIYGKNEGKQNIDRNVKREWASKRVREPVGKVLMLFCPPLLRQICELRKHIEKSRVNINSIHFCKHVPSWYFLDIFMRSPFVLPFLSFSSVSFFFHFLCPTISILDVSLRTLLFFNTSSLVFTLSLKWWQQKGRTIRIYLCISCFSNLLIFYSLLLCVAILLCINMYSVCVRMLHNFAFAQIQSNKAAIQSGKSDTITF